jgi:hypothetical protein
MTHSRIVTAYAVAVLSACLVLASCSLCSDEQRQTVESPDHALKATYFVRNCGATTDYVSTVNLQSSREKFDGNDGRVFVAKGEHGITLEWTGPQTLLVKCRTCTRKDLFQQTIALGNTDIHYELGPFSERK